MFNNSAWAVLSDRVDTVLAIIAILFACFQFFDSRRQKLRMDEIAKSMSTRFVGVFPRNMGDVLEVIKKAQQTVNIMIDICAYGHYSYPEMFFNYRLALEELAHRGVKVRMIVYDHARAAQDQEDVFYSVPGFFEREVNSKRFEHFFLSNRGLKRATTQDELKKVLFSEQAKYEAWLSDRGVEIRTVCETMLLFTWMADREDAVFSFRSEKGEREISFRTRDGNLLSTIGEDVFEQIWRQAAPINKAATTASA